MLGLYAAGTAYQSHQASQQNAQNKKAATKAFKRNVQESRRGYKRQLYMRKTQYQTAMGDMKAAGLNPMLAYQQGGASGQPGAQATAQAAKVAERSHIGSKIDPMMAIQAATAKASIRQMNAQTSLTEKKGDAQTYENYVPSLKYELATAVEARLRRALDTRKGTNTKSGSSGGGKKKTPNKYKYNEGERLQRNFDTEVEGWKSRPYTKYPTIYNPGRSGSSGGTRRGRK